VGNESIAINWLFQSSKRSRFSYANIYILYIGTHSFEFAHYHHLNN
jgi:hypothetical protein